MREAVEQGYATLEARPDVHDAYNKLVDEKCHNMVWVHSGVISWYKKVPRASRGMREGLHCGNSCTRKSAGH